MDKKIRRGALALALTLLFSLLAGCMPAAAPSAQTPAETAAVTEAPALVLLTAPPETAAPPEGPGETGPVPEQTGMPEAPAAPAPTDTPCPIDEDGVYTSRDDVALYLHIFGRLPDNFITKKQAQALGWPGGSLEEYAPGKCIGGDYFGNYEGLLPVEKGREYRECDIDTLGRRSRGAKRIIYSNDGLIYYTDDHYESFTLLYGEE